jgi:hypothetical protein
MLFSLLLACSATPLAPQSQPVAADYFPADTLAVVEFSLEPWDRLRKKTIAYDILSEGRILRTAADSLQRVLSDGHPLPKGYDIRQLASSTRFYAGVAGKSLPVGTVVIGFDALSLNAAASDPTVLLDAHEVPWRRIGTSVVAIFAIPGTYVPNEIQIEHILDQMKARGEGKLDEATLADSPSWQKLRSRLNAPDRVFGLWVPGESWSSANFLRLLPMDAVGEFSSDETLTAVLNQFTSKFELEKVVGFAFSSRVAPPFIEEEALVLGEGTLFDLAGPVPAAGFLMEQLAECDGDVGTASVSQNNLPLIGKLMASIVNELVGVFVTDSSDMDDYESEFKPMLYQASDLLQNLGPLVILEATVESAVKEELDRVRIEVKNRAPLEAAWMALDETIKGLLPFALLEAGVSADDMHLADDFWTYERRETLTGVRTLSQNPDFLPLARRLKKASGGLPIVRVEYFSKESQAISLKESLLLAEEGAEVVGIRLGAGFSKLVSRSDFESKLAPAGVVTMQTENGWLTRMHTPMGILLLVITQSMPNSLREAGFGGSVENLEEDEF